MRGYRGLMRPRAVLCAFTAVLTLSACTGSVAGNGVTGRPPAPGQGGKSSPGNACPAERAEPAADRPHIDLDFTLSDDGRTVTGIERVSFSPDLATDELVFRLTANQPRSAAAGSGIQVGAVSGDAVDEVGFEPAAAAADTQGGLLVVSLQRTLQPGESTELSIDFELALGGSGFDRFGADTGLSWWGSGYPLLAWVPDQGWSRDPLQDNPGETAVSMVADTSLRVLAPAGWTVAMTGGAQQVDSGRGLTRWESHERAARDVAVVAGRLVEVTGPGAGTELRVVAPGAEEAADLLTRAQAAIADLTKLFGPMPFPSVSLARLPDLGGGVEYPGLIMLADGSDLVLVHELAHMWFYGMVGDDQGRHPWLDESFATYAEEVVDGPFGDLDGRLRLPLDVGLPVGGFDTVDDYFATVYGKGSAMLLAARSAVGAAAFDAALRCYVDAQAWQIATPQDLALAFAELPEAVRILVDAGALPG